VYVELSERFDHVVIDLPAVSVSGEAITLAESCGVVALVVCQGVTPQAKVRETMDELNRVQVVGAVLNRSSTSVPRFIRRHIPGS
jgi:Mrp family chromosome partitioning ATPase